VLASSDISTVPLPKRNMSPSRRRETSPAVTVHVKENAVMRATATEFFRIENDDSERSGCIGSGSGGKGTYCGPERVSETKHRAACCNLLTYRIPYTVSQ